MRKRQIGAMMVFCFCVFRQDAVCAFLRFGYPDEGLVLGRRLPGRHFCGSVLTHYGTFIRRLQSPEGSARRMRLLRQPTPKEFVIASPSRTLDVAIRSPHAWGRIPTSAFSGLLGMTEFHRRGQPVLSAALCGKTTSWSSRSLPRKRSFLRPGTGVA